MRHLVAVAALFLVAGSLNAQVLQDRTDLLLSLFPFPPRASVGVSFVDFNKDGLVDIYRPGLLHRQRTDGYFEDMLIASGINDVTDGIQGGVWGDYDSNGFPDLFTIDKGGESRLYRSLANWRFARSEIFAGLPPGLRATGATWLDQNQDGRLELLLATETGPRHLVFTENGRLQDRTILSRLDGIQSACGVSVADYTGDGFTDAYFTLCGGETTDDHIAVSNRTVFLDSEDAISRVNFHPSRASTWLDYDRDGDFDLFVGNEVAEPILGPVRAFDRLYENVGDGTLELVDGSGAEGRTVDQAWGIASADFDNDGWVDLYVSNRSVPATELSPRIPPTHRLFRNQGDGTFADETDQLISVPFLDHVLPAVGDLNGDGWVDLYWSSPSSDRLFINTGGQNHWLRVRLAGVSANRNGIGSRIVVWSNGTPHAEQIAAGSGYASQNNDLSAHFGLGTASVADSVVVHWNGGSIQRLAGIAADQEIVVVQAVGIRSLPGQFALAEPADGRQFDLSDGDLHFQWEPAPASDGSSVLYDLRLYGPGVDTLVVGLPASEHVFDPSVLLQRQLYYWTVSARSEAGLRGSFGRRSFRYGGSTVSEPLVLPMDLGPVIDGEARFIDYDGDRDLDLFVIGTTADGRGLSRLYETADSLFLEGESSIPFKVFRDTNSILRNVTEGFSDWTDYDGDGDQDFVLGGFFRDIDGGEALHTELYRNVFGIIRPDGNAGGLPGLFRGDAEWADFDGDGDMDLLMAGAASLSESDPERSAMIFSNDGSGNLSAIGAGLTGMMFADVAWADFDMDGDPDVFMMGETSTGKFESHAYRNDGGSFTPMNTGLPGLAYGSMHWADYDGDGDVDLLMSGGRFSPELVTGETHVYRNDAGTLTDIGADQDLAGIAFGDARWLDYDLDGDLDIITTGADSPYGERISFVYRNEDGFRFAEEFKLAGLLFSTISAGDYNGDGDPELVILGEGSDGEAAALFFLSMINAETIPAALLGGR